LYLSFFGIYYFEAISYFKSFEDIFMGAALVSSASLALNQAAWKWPISSSPSQSLSDSAESTAITSTLLLSSKRVSSANPANGSAFESSMLSYWGVKDSSVATGADGAGGIELMEPLGSSCYFIPAAIVLFVPLATDFLLTIMMAPLSSYVRTKELK